MSVSGYWARTATGAAPDTAERFMQILQAGVVVNAGETAARFLASPACRAEISAHEMAHAQGQTHASMSRAILDRACEISTLSIQPLGAATRQASAVSSAAIATGSTFTIAWDAPTPAPAPATYIIKRFGAGSTTWRGSRPRNQDIVSPRVAPGIYYVRVYAANEVGSSPPSNEITLTVGGYCGTAPDAPAALASATNGSTVSLTWNPAAGGAASAYWIEAGSASGLSDLASFSTGSAATNFVATGVGAGTYFVRVKAMNGEAIGPASNEVRLTVSASSGPCYGAPNAPSGLARSVSGSTVTLVRNASAGSPSPYVIEAGSAAGLRPGELRHRRHIDHAARDRCRPRLPRARRARNACGTSAPSTSAGIRAIAIARRI